MIALRGKLERVDGNEGGSTSESPSSASASASAVSWRWKGQWAFGTKLGGKGPTTKALPFEYSWNRCVDPRTVEVPSALNHPNDVDAAATTEETAAEDPDEPAHEKMDESGPEESTEPAAATATNTDQSKEKSQGSTDTDTSTPKSKQEEKDPKATAALEDTKSDGTDETKSALNTVPAEQEKQDVLGADETKDQEKGVDTPTATATASVEPTTAKDPPRHDGAVLVV
jgi:hypothetical protein